MLLTDYLLFYLVNFVSDSWCHFTFIWLFLRLLIILKCFFMVLKILFLHFRTNSFFRIFLNHNFFISLLVWIGLVQMSAGFFCWLPFVLCFIFGQFILSHTHFWPFIFFYSSSQSILFFHANRFPPIFFFFVSDFLHDGSRWSSLVCGRHRRGQTIFLFHLLLFSILL